MSKPVCGVVYQEITHSLDDDTPGKNDAKGVTSTGDIVHDGRRV